MNCAPSFEHLPMPQVHLHLTPFVIKGICKKLCHYFKGKKWKRNHIRISLDQADHNPLSLKSYKIGSPMLIFKKSKMTFSLGETRFSNKFKL